MFTKTEIVRALRGKTITRVDLVRSDGEVRSIELRLSDGSVVMIAATTYQALAVSI